MDEEGKYQFEIIYLEEKIIRIKKNSRNLSQMIDNSSIQYSDDDRLRPIKSWYFDCNTGALTLSYCAQVIYYGIWVLQDKMKNI